MSDYLRRDFEDQSLQEVRFESSTWNLLLVMGLSDEGLWDDVIACLVLLVP